MPPVTPVSIRISPSNWMLIWVLLLHTLLASVCLLYFPYKIVMLGISLISCGWTLLNTGWLPGSKFINALQIDAKGKLSIKTKQQSDWQAVTLEDNSVLTRFICVLHLKENNYIHKICLLPDSMTHEHYRKLCVYGRWQKITNPSDQPLPN